MASEQEREAVARELQSFWCASADGATPERGLNPWLACADAALSMRDAAVAKALDDAAGRVAAKMYHDRDCFSDSFQRCDCVNDEHNRTIAAAVRAIKKGGK